MSAASSGKTIHIKALWLACLTVLMSTALPANATPTVEISNATADWTVVTSSDLHSHDLLATSETSQGDNSVLAAAAQQLFKPPTDRDASAASASTAVATFPAVPGALYLALTGFLAVLLGRNRKAVAAAFIALFCLSQTATHAATSLARSALNEKHCRRQPAPELSWRQHLLTASAMRRVIELAQHTSASLATSSAIMPDQYHLDTQSKCLSSTYEAFICFSPAFIFAHLARGPPILT